MAAILVPMYCVCDLITIRNNKETGPKYREMKLPLRVVSHDMFFYRMIIAKNSYSSANVALIDNMAAILVTMYCVCDLVTIRNNKETGLRHREMGKQVRVFVRDMFVFMITIA